ncbi:MAG: hypothetical protein ACI8V2_003857 [Candidatus Latescibacterota bacterium]|jgi:uncharacterized protein with HEPN domain
MKEDRIYLTHILECIQRIEDYTKGNKTHFKESILIQDAVLRNLQTMSESTQHISDALKADYPDVDWRAISGFRNVLVHNYFGIDLDRVWEVIGNRIQPLKQKVNIMLNNLPD